MREQSKHVSIYFQHYYLKGAKSSHNAMAPGQWVPYSPQSSLNMLILCINNIAKHYITICMCSRLPRNND